MILDARHLVVEVILRGLAAADGEMNSMRCEIETIRNFNGPELDRAEYVRISRMHAAAPVAEMLRIERISEASAMSMGDEPQQRFSKNVAKSPVRVFKRLIQ